MTDPVDLTPKERHFIRHALGLTNAKVGYRNRFFADPGGPDMEIGRALASRGLAHGRPRVDKQRLVEFHITKAGFEAARRPGEKMDREETEFMLELETLKSKQDAAGHSKTQQETPS